MVIRGWQILAVSRMNSPSHFYDCLTCVHSGAVPVIVMKEKDIFHVSVRMNSTDALSQFI
jgi:hypothetical protein